MKILVIGGGVFIGRAFVEAAMRRGHQVTVFNRGKRNSEFPPGVRWIQGDRDGDLAPLREGTWDAVVDVCAYFPRQVRSLLGALAGRTDRYLLVSSISAYQSMAVVGQDESSPLAAGIEPEPTVVTPENYGPLKAEAERVALKAGPACTLIVRPCIVIGPWDPTDRFTYWVRRLATGGEVVVPGRPEAPVQLIDARDLAAFILVLVEEGRVGAYNAVGPATLTWGTLMEATAAALRVPSTLCWVDDAFAKAQGVDDSTLLPLYIPESNAAFEGFFRFDGRAAEARGLRHRPLEETVRDIAQWLKDPASASSRQLGLAPEREREVLAAWHARSS